MFLHLILICSLALTGAPGGDYSSNQDTQLAAYIEQALERNPAVKQSLARYRAALQRLPQERSLPDPMFSVTQFARTPETRVGPQTTVVSVSQHFPWFGKLSDREKVAAKEAAALEQQHEAQKAEVVRQVKLAYYSLGYIDRAIEITEEDLALLQHYETLAQARYSQGMGLQQAVVKLQAEITRDRNRLKELQSRRVDAEAVLNTLMDYPARNPIAKVTQGTRPNVQIDYGALFEIGRTHRPEVLGALLLVERDDIRIQLAQLNYRPDFTLGASFGNVLGRSDAAGRFNPPEQNGKNTYSITFGMNIPIRRAKYDAAVQQATEEKTASGEGYRNTLNTVNSSVRSIGFSIVTLEEQIGLFERTLLPQAQQALLSSESAYSTGTLGVLDLLDSERVLLEVRLTLARLTSEYMKALAEMERTIGASYPEVKP